MSDYGKLDIDKFFNTKISPWDLSLFGILAKSKQEANELVARLIYNYTGHQHVCIFVPNMKFLCLNLWLGGPYTDNDIDART